VFPSPPAVTASGTSPVHLAAQKVLRSSCRKACGGSAMLAAEDPQSCSGYLTWPGTLLPAVNELRGVAPES